MQSGEEFRSHPFFASIDFGRLLRRELRPEFIPDVADNDLKYFDKQFTQEKVSMPQLDQPNDPSDPTSKKFENYNFTSHPAPAASAHDLL
jgi:hypothetical protein